MRINALPENARPVGDDAETLPIEPTLPVPTVPPVEVDASVRLPPHAVCRCGEDVNHYEVPWVTTHQVCYHCMLKGHAKPNTGRSITAGEPRIVAHVWCLNCGRDADYCMGGAECRAFSREGWSIVDVQYFRPPRSVDDPELLTTFRHKPTNDQSTTEDARALEPDELYRADVRDQSGGVSCCALPSEAKRYGRPVCETCGSYLDVGVG